MAAEILLKRKRLKGTRLILKAVVLCFLSLVAVSIWSDVSKISELVDSGAIQTGDAIPVVRGTDNLKYLGLKGALDGKENAGAAASAVSTHEGLSDPHTVYLTVSEADALYEAAGAVATHAGQADPHPGYLTQAEGDARYSLTTHTHAGGSEAFPVGAVFIAVVNTDPATLLGYGTWSAFAAGRMLVGVNSGDTDFDTAEETGGAKTSSAVVNHTHPVVVDDPQHSHVENSNNVTTGGLRGWAAADTSTNTSTATGYSTALASTGITATTSNPAGGVASFSLMNPYICVFMWKRTA